VNKEYGLKKGKGEEGGGGGGGGGGGHVLARCGTVFRVSVVMGAAVPAASCRWGLRPCCPGVGRCLSRVIIIISMPRWAMNKATILFLQCR